MASGGGKSDTDEEISTCEESDEDYGWTFDDDFLTATKLQELEYDLPSLGDGPSASTSSKLQVESSEMSRERGERMESKEPALLNRTPKIKSTPRSMQLVGKILVDEYKLEEDEAKAAVRCQGCDIESCLRWVERNRFNFALLEEKSKEFEYICGTISKYEMKKWIVERLTSKFNVADEIAKAAVQIEGCESWRNCKIFALSIKGTDNVVEKAAAYDKEIEKGGSSNEDKGNFQETLEELDQLPLYRCPWNSFGIEEKECFSVPRWPSGWNRILGFQTMFEWFLRNQHGMETLQLQMSSCTEGAVRILSDFMPKIVAKAAVQACSHLRPNTESVVHLGRCRDWAKTNDHDEEIIKNYYRKFTGAIRIRSTSMSIRMARKILVNEYKVEGDEAAAAVQSQGCDIDLCLYWIGSRPDPGLVQENLKNFLLRSEERGPFTLEAESFEEVLKKLYDLPIARCPWDAFGIGRDLTVDRCRGTIFGFETVFEWLLRNQFDDLMLKELCSDEHYRLLSTKETAMRILSVFMPETVALAAVQACFNSVSRLGEGT